MTTFAKNPLALTMIALLGLGLTACGGDNKPAETKTETKTDAGTAPAKPASGEQTITINNASEPETLDPHLAQGVQEANIIRQFAVGLVITDTDGKVVPAMATEWKTDDNKVWTFKLRNDAKWSNGDPVTAHDFVYSFRRLIDPKTGSYYASYLEDAKLVNAADIIAGTKPTDTLGIKAIDDYTLEITLSEAVPYLPDMLITSMVVPVHQKTVEQFGEKWTDPKNIVVNGPFKPTEWVVNEKIVLERNKGFYDDANTKLDKLVVLPINVATTDVQRYQAGEIDITASEIPPEQFEGLKKDLGDQLKTAPTLCTYYYDLNNEKPPFNDVKVRRALALALDRETITDKVLGQGQIPAYQFTPIAVAGGVKFEPEWKAWDKTKRIEEAKKLLNEAGYNEQNPLKFELLYDTNEQHKKIAVAASSIWKEALGFVEVSLMNQEWKTYLDSRRNGKYEMARARWCGDYNEASTFLNLKKSNNTNNWTRFKNAEYDALMLKTLDPSLDTQGRTKLYEQAEKMIEDHSAHINVLYYANVRLVKPHVQGYSNKDPMDFWQAKDWSVAK